MVEEQSSSGSLLLWLRERLSSSMVEEQNGIPYNKCFFFIFHFSCQILSNNTHITTGLKLNYYIEKIKNEKRDKPYCRKFQEQ